MHSQGDRRAVAYAAAAMYSGAMVVVFVEAALPAGIPDELVLTLSVGLAASGPPVDPHALLLAADDALYAAKRAGRDRIVRAGVSPVPT